LHTSAGFAVLEPRSTESLDDAIDRADSAMYLQKRGRRAYGRLLVVEDEPSLQSLISVVLQDDADVTIASSVEEASGMLAFKKVDAVIADLHLPGASGLDMVVAMRERAETANIPVLILTGGGDERIEERCLAAGADDFLTKPFEPEVLRWRTRRLLERRAGR
jgi:DNA-binding response OmpR family regulator